jgi:hypothetical protein
MPGDLDFMIGIPECQPDVLLKEDVFNIGSLQASVQ